MKAMQALIRKEWRMVLDTPMAYVMITVFLAVTGFFFANQLFLVGQADMRGLFQIMPVLLMFFVPAMAMRCFSDELQTGTFELLATLPVRHVQLLAAKYIALMQQLCLLLLLTLPYPIFLYLWGHPDLGQIVASYVAVMFLLALQAALCLWASVLSRHVVVAYVLGFFMLLLLYVLGMGLSLLPLAVQDVFVVMSPLFHYQSMLRGVIAVDDVLVFISLSLFALTLAWFQLERKRWR